MPELPEVEITRRGIAPHLLGMAVTGADLRVTRLRWPLPEGLTEQLLGRTLRGLERRGKYLLFAMDSGTMLLHLGMTGRLTVFSALPPSGPHDRLDIAFANGRTLRLHDPRRFASLHWTEQDPLQHPLLANLGPEPLSPGFTGDYLYEVSRRRSMAIKPLLMDSRLLAGVGNIYASEALYRAGILPQRPAGELNRRECQQLAVALVQTLEDSLAAGMASLERFLDGEGTGYHPLELAVYGRAGKPCPRCSAPIQQVRLGGRSSCFCPHCQH